MQPADLLDVWRRRADELDRYTAPAAEAFREAAKELEDALEGSQLQLLTLDEAELESGYTRGHLRRLIKEGGIPNAGTDRLPLLRRSDLPRKPGYRAFGIAQEPEQIAYSRSQVAHAVVTGKI